MSFFFKVYPEIIQDGRLFIAEPPLYRVDDKKNEFVINTADYMNRYVTQAMKYYKIGYKHKDEITYIDKDKCYEFMTDTRKYVDDIGKLVDHFKNNINDRLLEMIIEEFALMYRISKDNLFERLNVQHMMNRIGTKFKEIKYIDSQNIIKGSIDSKWQMLEISPIFIRRVYPLIELMAKWSPDENDSLILKDIKTGMDQELSMLELLKILKKFQPGIEHRFKGLGENDESDIKKTIMDPNTRTLIRVNIGDIENDMKIFQVLRGGSPLDALHRKSLVASFKINKDDIDT